MRVLCCADAGADIHSWTDSSTDYDLVQTAANGADTEAVVKLVEAGANWKLPVGKRIQAGLVFYAPEILSINVPNLKVCDCVWLCVLCIISSSPP